MIQVKNIFKKYLANENEVLALKDVSINFRNSEFVSILGPSGCGKTTLLNIIGGLDKYTSGDIIINGVSTKDYKDKDWDAYRNHYIGFVFQSYNLINHLSVLENVELALSVAGISKKEKRKKAIKALKEVGLEGQIKKKPNQLSGGQMQRVAIARAIVNEPKIILADEPTGALDSETSVQVMDILKKISSKYLIVMVTHNDKLASEYSTRIINILDGKILGDTDPYNPTEEEINKDKIEFEKKDEKQKEKIKQKKIKTAMSYGTSFMLSLKNLWSKKGKTIIESIAGSIGIIGIALVLAVSSGFTNYINTLQTNTLGGYPLTVGMVAANMNAVMNGGMQEIAGELQKDESEDALGVYDTQAMIESLGHLNLFSDDFLDYLDNYVDEDSKKSEAERDLKGIKYEYNLPLKLLTKQNSNISYVLNDNSTSVFSSSSAILYEIIDEKEWILENYDVVAGDYATKSNEIMLVVDSDNKMDINTIKNLGLPYSFNEETGKYDSIKYTDIVDKSEYVLVLNNAYYNTDYTTKDLTDNSVLQELFDNAEDLNNFDVTNDGLLKIKISGVLKPKENVDTEILSTGLVYLPELRELYNTNSLNSDIVKDSLNTITNNTETGDNAYNIEFPWVYSIDVSEMSMVGGANSLYTFTNTSSMIQYVKSALNMDISYKQAFNMALQAVGVTNTPTAINFYPTSFDAKQNIINMLEDWNKTEIGSKQNILYTDLTEILTQTMGQMIDIISYVLIAFAGISLVVSSSVVERTKEIGVLRSIGARKKDISRIFNSETILVGLFAGLLGVGISWILTFPISSIIKSVAGGAITTNMAILQPLDALWLVIISTVLTAIAGTIPARIASKKDPVKCLRSQ